MSAKFPYPELTYQKKSIIKNSFKEMLWGA